MIQRNRLVYLGICMTAGIIGRIFGRLRIYGRKNIPKRGPFILVANHLSHLDPPTLAYACPRFTFFMAKDELFRVPGVGWALTKIGTFPVKRGAPDRTAIRRALATLAAGEPLGMFPEGHRSEDGRLQAGEDGVALIALRSRAPIVPAAVIGTNTVLPPHAKRPHFGKSCIRFGEPFTLDDLYEQSGREALGEATRRVMAAIAALLPPEHLPLPEAEGTPAAPVRP